METFDVIVIGAGAAGMMCAAQAGRRGRRVLLIEHAAKLGERIRISGGGRCNFSNRRVGAENFLSRNRHFCRSALAQFTPQDFIDLIQRHGVRYEERNHGQLFCLESAQDVIDLLKAECERARVKWAMPCEVLAVKAIQGHTGHAGDGKASAINTAPRFTLATSRGPLACHSLVVATGGLAVPKLGATPFGYKLAEQFGLDMVPPKPALVPLALAPDTLHKLQALSGVSVNVQTACHGDTGQPDTTFREDMLLTHRGLSGPAILQISSYWQSQEYPTRRGKVSEKQPVVVDLLPGTDAADWLESHARSRALLSNVLAERLPRRFAQAWVELHAEDKPMNELPAADRRSVAEALQAWELMPSGTLGYAKAEVTLGGVSTAGLSSQTMEAVRVPGLYFIGEVVDVTGWLGGYNFQWAWSSGWVAGQHA